MDEFTKYFEVLRDSYKLRIICAVQEKRLCDCQIAVLLGLSQEIVSKHLDTLISSGFLTSIKIEGWTYYHMASSSNIYKKNILDEATGAAKITQRIKIDKKRLKEILKIPKENLHNKNNK